MRKHLNLFANVRPAKIISERQLKLSSLKDDVVRGVNLITLRENAGGIYFGKKQEPDQHAMKGKLNAIIDQYRKYLLTVPELIASMAASICASTHERRLFG